MPKHTDERNWRLNIDATKHFDYLAISEREIHTYILINPSSRKTIQDIKKSGYIKLRLNINSSHTSINA